MKYKDSDGQWKELYLKPSGDTLPIGTVVDYDGETIPYGYEEVGEKIEVLHDGAVSTKTTITLSKSYKEFDFIVVTVFGGSYGINTIVIPTDGIKLSTGDVNNYNCVAFQGPNVYAATQFRFESETLIRIVGLNYAGWASAGISKIIGIKL